MTPRLDVIGVVASDLAASFAFYRRLGLDIPEGAETQPHVEVALAGGMRILFDTEETVRSFNPQWRPPTSDGRVGLAFHCDSPEEVDAVYAGLVEAGHRGELKPWNAFWGQRYAGVFDPDGNLVSLYADLPGGPA